MTNSLGFDLNSAKEVIFKPNKDKITFNVLVKYDKEFIKGVSEEVDFFYPKVYINKIDAEILADQI